jgi:hypothetical protein
MQRDAVQRLEWAQKLEQAVGELTLLNKRHDEEIAAFRAMMQEQTARSRRLDALLYEALRQLAAPRAGFASSDRFILAKGDQTSIHPILQDAGEPADAQQSDVLSGADEQTGADVVQDLPLVLAPEVTPLFEPMASDAMCSVGCDLEQMAAVGECARVWLMARNGDAGEVTVEQLQQVATAFGRTLRGHVYDRTAFVHGMCLLLEAAAADEDCDGSLVWVQNNVENYSEMIRERLREQAQAGRSFSNAQVV